MIVVDIHAQVVSPHISGVVACKDNCWYRNRYLIIISSGQKISSYQSLLPEHDRIGSEEVEIRNVKEPVDVCGQASENMERRQKNESDMKA